jgi:glucuronoxylan 4-O-methyltransferase
MKLFKKLIKRLAPKAAISFGVLWPSYKSIGLVRKHNEIQITVEELKTIADVLRRRRACNFLVFGLGNDSLFWSKFNHGGKTVFVEDDNEWFSKVLKKNNGLTAYLVDYRTRLTQWEEFLGSPAVFDLDLPEAVRSLQWDVILVDAPAGWYDTAPGRMKSIAAASRLARDSGDVFVHDCDRNIEKIYCDRYLKSENLVAEVGKLKHFRMNRDNT